MLRQPLTAGFSLSGILNREGCLGGVSEEKVGIICSVVVVDQDPAGNVHPVVLLVSGTGVAAVAAVCGELTVAVSWQHPSLEAGPNHIPNRMLLLTRPAVGGEGPLFPAVLSGASGLMVFGLITLPVWVCPDAVLQAFVFG